MSFYTTPLQFGYFFGCLFAILLWVRGNREERLSDTMLGWVLFLLVLEIQDYTFGFSGINFLWEELNGFPRSLSFLFGPTIYFYLKSQINRQFSFRMADLLHLIPWMVYFLFHSAIFLQGSDFVKEWQSSVAGRVTDVIETLAILGVYAVYFAKSLSMYRQYRQWTETQFSDTDAVSLIWYRNFLYLMIFIILFKWLWFFIDVVLTLDFYQDWWWNLATVAAIVYVTISGYQQQQTMKMVFNESGAATEPSRRVIPDLDVADWKQKLLVVMEQEKPYLEPELTLADLARKLKIAPPLLSQVINTAFEKNFNDFINAYRVEDFKMRMQRPEVRHLTLLGIALDCGFNSKATFNRAFRKHTGQSPSEYGANSVQREYDE
ncbi:MAG: helix-turn-helix transcriptional regulator [Saprospiraceae bacterium]|nr:helix-turn-helix transcriptional regulator [Saprospiraceae bacterium]